MFKSLVYKEWIKTRWFLAGYLLLGLIAVAYLFLNVQHDFKFFGGKNYWNSILFQHLSYFSSFKFIPLVGGITIGISQYIPETIDKRIKLSFHLPLKENKLLIQMMAYGTVTLLLSYICLFTLFFAFSNVFFPREIVSDALISITPWFLSGFAAYYFIGLIVMEPIWKYRFLYLLVGASFITFYLEKCIAGAYAPMNSIFIIATMVLSISLLFSSYRFRKGEQ